MQSYTQSRLTTPRNEQDAIEILSGVYEGVTLGTIFLLSFSHVRLFLSCIHSLSPLKGTPIGMIVRNKDQKSKDYNDALTTSYRPSHADATYDAKYGVRAIAGGGRSSARETIGRVAGGAVAKKILQLYSGTEIIGYVQRVQDIELKTQNYDLISEEMVESNIVRCPDPEVANKMIDRIDEIRRKGNSIGGVVEVVVKNYPSGMGSPVFDKLEAELAKACMSLPAAKGFEIGSGFEGT